MSASWEATHAFNRFLFVLSYFVGNCPRPIRENGGKKKLSLRCQKLGTARACSGTAVPSQALQNPKIPEAWHARAQPTPYKNPIFPFFFHHSSTTTSLISQTSL